MSRLLRRILADICFACLGVIIAMIFSVDGGNLVMQLLDDRSPLDRYVIAGLSFAAFVASAVCLSEAMECCLDLFRALGRIHLRMRIERWNLVINYGIRPASRS